MTDLNDKSKYLVVRCRDNGDPYEIIGGTDAENTAKAQATDAAKNTPGDTIALFQRIGTVKASVEAKWS